jgi:sigma-B regulation protein RsbU (phosphoserine phosphatase)
MKILVVEDDPISTRLLSEFLERMGHELTEAGNGRDGWSLFQTHPFRCVISDWMMPEMSGVELCRRIRKENRTHYSYFILLTARSGKEDYMEVMDAGADDFLTKPVDQDQLFTRVRVTYFAT